MRKKLKPVPKTNPIDIASENLYFDGKYFWHRHATQRWEYLSVDSAGRLLRVTYRLSGRRPKNLASQIDLVLRKVENDHRIAAGAPFVHDARDLITYRGEVYLNTSTVKPISPADSGDPAKFPWLHNYFNKIWAEPTEKQRNHYLAWFQHFYGSALNGRMLAGQHVVDAGPTGQGKTCTSRRIVGDALGGYASAANFLKGQTVFNHECARFAVWTMDDEDGTFTWEQRMTFSNSLKSSAANQEVRCEPKFMNAFTIPWFGRVYLTCNVDVRSLHILPDMRGGIADKIMLFRRGDWKPEFLDRDANEQRIKDELPYFLRWLLEWKPPAYVLSNEPRFKINPYHHPSLVGAARASASETRLQEMLHEWRENRASIEPNCTLTEKWFTVTALRAELSQEPSFRDALREFSRDRMREALEELGTEHVIRTRIHNNTQQYLMNLRRPA